MPPVHSSKCILPAEPRMDDPDAIELETLTNNGESTSSQSSKITSISESYDGENTRDTIQIISRLPFISQVLPSQQFVQSRTSLRHGLASVLAVECNDNSKDKDLSQREGSSSTILPSQVRSSISSVAENSGLSTVQNLGIDKATELLNSTASLLTEYKERILGVPPLLWQRAVNCIQTTWRGSADDIGWLRRISGSADLHDQTERFEQILELVCHGVHLLPDDLIYLLVPGLFSNYGPLYFAETKSYFSKLGLTCHIAKIHSESAVETNASILRNYIEELYWGSGKKVAILGHSKGGVDAAAAVAMNWSDLKEKVVGLILVQSPYGGSPIAADILREGQIADVQTRYFMELLMQKLVKGDIQSLEDLTYTRRQRFLAKHPLPPDFPVISFHTEVNMDPTVLSMMSHIAHAELPWQTTSDEAANATKLPVLLPLPALMALCAKHIELRYGYKSDGLVVRDDAEAPGSVVVRPARKLDHAWMVYSSTGRKETGPNPAQMCETLMVLLFEICKRTKAD